MSLYDKVSKFEQLCHQLLRKAQAIDPNKPFRFGNPPPPASLSGPIPRYSVPTRIEEPVDATPPMQPAAPTMPSPKKPQATPTVRSTQSQPQPKLNIPDQFIKDFAAKLINFNPEQWEGVSVDAEELKKAGVALNTAVSNKQPWAILKALQSILALTRNGGGSIYGVAQRIYSSVQQSIPKAPLKPKEDFLDRYMKEQKLKDWADSQMQGMEAQKNAPVAVQEVLNRSNEYDPRLGF